MTGPEHYRKAEEILAEAEDAAPGADPKDIALLLQFAQVHATLAQAAATAAGGFAGSVFGPDYNAWREAAGVKGGAE